MFARKQKICAVFTLSIGLGLKSVREDTGHCRAVRLSGSGSRYCFGHSSFFLVNTEIDTQS